MRAGVAIGQTYDCNAAAELRQRSPGSLAERRSKVRENSRRAGARRVKFRRKTRQKLFPRV